MRTTFRHLEDLANELSHASGKNYSILQSSPQANGTRRYALMIDNRYSEEENQYKTAYILAGIIRRKIEQEEG